MAACAHAGRVRTKEEADGEASPATGARGREAPARAMSSAETQQQPSGQARLRLAHGIARALNSANNAIALYPPESPMPREAAAGFIAALDRFLMFEPYLQLTVAVDQLLLDEQDICSASQSLRRFAFTLHSRQVGQIRFLPGLDPDECVAFLRVLAADPDVLRDKGGLAKVAKAKGVSHVLVVDLAQEAAAQSSSVSPDATLVAGVAGLREEALISPDASEACVWLQQSVDALAGQGLGTAEEAGEIAKVLSLEAGKALEFGGGDAELGLDNLSQAIASLDESTRRSLIGALLNAADAATTGLEALLGRVSESELVAALAAQATQSGTDPAQLLAGAPLDAERRERLGAQTNTLIEAQSAPKAAQPPPKPVAKPTTAAPSDISRLPRYSRLDDDVAFSATQLATQVRQFSQEERDSLLQAPHEAQALEIERSIVTLLHLLNRAREDSQAAETVASIVDTASYALDMGRISTATRAVSGMRLALEHIDPATPYARRLEAGIEALSSPDAAAKVVVLLDGSEGASRSADAVAYFASAQPQALEAALDTIASNVTTELRGRVHAVLKELGLRALGTLERHVLDKRWIVAHSSVVVLSGLHQTRVVPSLRRALSHSEPRVVEAAMRGLAAIGGAEAEDALAVALRSAPEQLQLLALDLVGRMRAASAVNALGEIAETGDLFGRTLDVKLAAVAALGAIGTPEAVQVLQEAEHSRFLLSPSKTRRFRAAVRDMLAHLGDAAVEAQAESASSEGRDGA